MKEQAAQIFADEPDATPPLSAAQWQGLARLGDIANLVASAMQTPAGGLLAEQADRVAEGYLLNDVPELLHDVLATLRSLRDSGVLDLLRENADVFMQTLELARPLLDAAWSRLDGLDLEAVRSDVQFAAATLRKARTISGFVDANLSEDLAARLSAVLEVASREDLAGTLSDVVQTLAHLRANGTLELLRESSDYLTDAIGGMDRRELVPELVRRFEQLPLMELGRLGGATERALEDARRESYELGGVRGLFRLLTDRQVQTGLVALGSLLRELSQPAPAAGHHPPAP